MRSSLVVVASILFCSFAASYAQEPFLPPQAQEGLPTDPQQWVCPQTDPPVTPKDIREWCDSHQNRGLPLPADLRDPPLVSDFANYQKYSDRLREFLSGKDTKGNPVMSFKDLGWISDKNWRLTGPSVSPPGGDYSHNYGPHFPLKIYYSPEIVEWLCNGRKGQIPDGAMMVKAMALFNLPLFGDFVKIDVDANQCMQVNPIDRKGNPLADDLWTPMLKTSKSSYDGWLWSLQQPDFSFLGVPAQFPPPLFDESAFTTPLPSRIQDNPMWYPTGSVVEETGPFPIIPLKVPNTVMMNGYPGMAYCLSCHSTAESQSTFASMDNILGRELKYKAFPVKAPSPSPTPGNFSPFPKPLPVPSQAFLSFFDEINEVRFDQAWATRMPAETWEQHITSGSNGPAQFLTAAQCSFCHDATAQSSLLPNMVFLEDKPARSSRLRNLSQYGEWHVSPMGLAGRDPVFFSQLQGETNNLSQFTTCIENTCLHCHASMGQRQLAIDTAGKEDGGCKDMFAIEPPREVPFGTPLARATLQQWPGSTPSDQERYASLGRDGISCTVCHHISPKNLGDERAFTGNFVSGKPNEIFGPYKNVAKTPMEHALGLHPKFGKQTSASELCASCHAILLPIFDNSGNKLGASYEQSTYLEWLNSDSARRGAQFKSCQDCHMPVQYKGHDLSFNIANSEDPQEFPPTTNRSADEKIALTQRSPFHRHALHGLNGFLNQFFQQFPLILGFQQVDFMSEQPSPLDPPAPPFRSNYQMELPLFTGFESMLDMARNQTATLAVGPVQKANGLLQTSVTVTNLTGHNLPTGVGFRRMFIEFLAFDQQENMLWASGRTNDLGFILNGTTDEVLFSEQPAVYPYAQIQPHYQTIGSGRQVQIYQELIRDSDGILTTSFLRRVSPIKDNRIRPKGFDPKFFARSSSPYIRELAVLHGEEANDPSYFDPAQTGADTIEYRIPLDPETLSRVDHVQVTLYYQSIPPFYLQQRFQDASVGPGNRDDINRLFYLTSHLNLNDAKSEAGDPVLQGWKLMIAQQTRQAN